MNFSVDSTRTEDDSIALPGFASVPAHSANENVPEPTPRIALLTPYNGGNLGDAAIQDSMIVDIRRRLPGAQFSGITLNCANFIERHGTDAFPICAMDIPFYHMLEGTVANWRKADVSSQPAASQNDWKSAVKRAIKSVRPLWSCLKPIRACWRELSHWVQGYRFLRAHDLLVVSGGGQLNEEWGGAWGQPFALFKWAVLARLARIPYVMVSLGLGKVTSKTSRMLLSGALRMARYRSYRDKNSRSFAAGLLQIASQDPIVADLVLALPSSEVPQPSQIRALAKGRLTVAISPIAYAKPTKWPSENRAIYERYMVQMARVVSQLLERDCFLVIVCSSLWDDESAIADLLGNLDDSSKKRLIHQMHSPSITTWKDLVATLLDVDLLIASRLHSAILGFVAQRPTVAVSFEAKVDWVMEDVGQTDYLFQIRDFDADDVMAALDRISIRGNHVVEQVESYRRGIRSATALQYDAVAGFALESRRHRIAANAKTRREMES